MTRSFLLLVVAVLAVTAASEQARAQKAVILIRHADRDSVAADALKNPEGFERAQALAGVLKDAGVTAIVRSEAQRVKDTVEPLKGLLTNPPPVMEVLYGGRPLKDHVDEAVAKIKAADAEAVVLYVGHSDTLGPVLHALGGPMAYPFGGDEFGNMVILIPGGQKPTVLHMHYSGKP